MLMPDRLAETLPPIETRPRDAASTGDAPVQRTFDRMSLFLDVDGTLVEFAARPDGGYVDARLQDALAAVYAGLGGALAIVSGRSVADLSRLFAPLTFSVVGQHGAEWRNAGHRTIHRITISEMPAALRADIDAVARAMQASMVEDKGVCVAVHHTGEPTMQARLYGALREVAARAGPDWSVMAGRRVFEVKPALVDKGSACERLLREQPFAGTVPVAFGDDITDLDMFEAIDAAGGVTVGVGPRIRGSARHHVNGPIDVVCALEWLAEHVGRDDPTELIRRAVASLSGR
mgnify:CR=1 FL=1